MGDEIPESVRGKRISLENVEVAFDVSVHSEYVLVADVIVASETTVFSDYPRLAFGIAPGDGLFVVWEEALGLNRARHLEITQGPSPPSKHSNGEQSPRWYRSHEVPPRAQAIAEEITRLPQLTNRYMAVVFRQRISRRLAEGTSLGMALKALTAENLAYLQPAEPAEAAM